jgi:hypothetical protein
MKTSHTAAGITEAWPSADRKSAASFLAAASKGNASKIEKTQPPMEAILFQWLQKQTMGPQDSP